MKILSLAVLPVAFSLFIPPQPFAAPLLPGSILRLPLLAHPTATSPPPTTLTSSTLPTAKPQLPLHADAVNADLKKRQESITFGAPPGKSKVP